ncbi:unnamed protein product [Brachionus calyciflorus]|uniref:Uncharacterized protein n=1 Tax=Brachionus calyciflorus TaxID=104777 RepID=A0A813R3D0_9BILA|nr:unnamed protein product [Brachionus calyciflorus]
MINLLIILFGIGSITSSNSNSRTHWEISNLKQEFLESLLNEIGTTYNQHLNSLKQDDEYQRFFGSLFYQNEEPKQDLKPKQKRFLKGFFDKLLNKNKTTTKSTHVDSYYGDLSDFEIPTTTEKTTTKSKYSSHQFSSKTFTTPPTKENDDVFYKLKQHCSRAFDRLCLTKKQELNELVRKCERLKTEYNGKQIEACNDVLSIYCYVFNEVSTCFGNNYPRYEPGRKLYSTTSPTRSPSTQSSIRIPVIVVTSSKSSSSTTSRQITSPTTTKSTTPSTTKKEIIKSTQKSVTVPNSDNFISPFDGPVTSIPKSAEKLKQIGNYCLKIKHRDQNCDIMLALLKEKFKICEKKPKTDSDCQIFKIQFCSAFENFPCCPDVLAGRQCNGKSNSLKRSYLSL